MSEAPKGGGHDTVHPRGLRRLRHGLKKQTFQEVGDGTVRVTCDDGRVGVFKPDGTYVAGELTQASMQMLLWVSDPRLPDDCDFRWTQVPVDLDRPSGWPEAQERILHDYLGEPRRAKSD